MTGERAGQRGIRLTALVALLVQSVIVTGCSAPPAPDAIRFGLPAPATTLDPRFATDAVSYRLVRLLHRQLVVFDAAAEPVGDLATPVRVGPLVYRFALDPDARFSDGRPVTAADVVATYRSVLDPSTASPHRGSLANVREVVAVDTGVVEFRLHAPDALFPGTLVVGILPEEATAGARESFTRTSGPFTLESRRRDGTIVLSRRTDDARFAFHVVRDPTVRALKLAKGELDIVQGNIPPEQFEWLARQPGLVARQHAGSTFSYIGFNLDSGPGASRAMRRAVAHAIDREAIIAHLLRGYARPANALFPPTHWAGAPALAGYAHDPERARALLAQAESRPRIQLKTSSDPLRIRIASALASQLAQAGIDVDIRSLDWGTFYGDVKRGRFEAYTLSWVGLELPDIFRYAFHSASVPPRGANRGRYADAQADRLIEAAEREPVRARRVPIYHALQERLLYDLPYVPLWFEDQLVVMRDDIVGYTTREDGHFDALVGTQRSEPNGG